MASFCVEKFGTQKLTEIKKEDVLERAQVHPYTNGTQEPSSQVANES